MLAGMQLSSMAVDCRCNRLGLLAADTPSLLCRRSGDTCGLEFRRALDEYTCPEPTRAPRRILVKFF